MSNTNYVRYFNVNGIKVDAPNESFVHEIPILSFKDVYRTINLSMVFNYRMFRDEEGSNSYNIACGYKLNLQKKLIFSDEDVSHLQDEAGNKVELIKINDNLYTFDDDSQRILRKNTNNTYILEYPDNSQEKYNTSGNIIGIYDKYVKCDTDPPYLSYTYSNGLLTEIAYRTDKKIRFSYTNSKLTTIQYVVSSTAVCATGINYRTNNSVVIRHYSGAVYQYSYSDYDDGVQTGCTFTVTSKNAAISVETLECTVRDSNPTEPCIINTSYHVDGKSVDNNSYEIRPAYTRGITTPDNMGAAYHALYHTDKHGVMRMLSFKGTKQMYSYEMSDHNVDFFNWGDDDEFDKYVGTVERYNIENESKNKNPFVKQTFNDGDLMTRINNDRWLDSSYTPSGLKCYCILSGWIKKISDDYSYNDPEISILSDTGYPLTTFRVPLFRTGEWTYFAYQFEYNNSSYIVAVENEGSIFASKDFRIMHVPTHIMPYEEVGEKTLSDDRLFLNDLTSFSLTDLVFKKDNQVIEGTVHASDLLRYLRNKNNEVHFDEFYTDNCKNIVTLSSTSSITVSDGSGNYNLSNLYLANVKGILGHILTTKYTFSNDASSNVRLTVSVLDKKDNTDADEIAMQEYDGHMDMIRSQSNGVTTVYTRTGKGLVISERVTSTEPDITRSAVYDLGLTKFISSTDEFGNTTTYTTDGTWGTVTAYTAGGQTVRNTYDGDMCTITETAFSVISSGRKTLFEYGYGKLGALTHGDISYQYGYDGIDISSVTKNNVSVESHTYTESSGNTTVESNYGSYTDTQVFDKYGRLVSVDGVLSNTYYIYPHYMSDSFQIINRNNSSALLSSTVDQLSGRTIQYAYNEKEQISEIAIKATSTGSEVSRESFEYDNSDRLLTDTFSIGSRTFKSEYTYVKANQDANDPTIDGKIISSAYEMDGSEVCNTANEYNDFNEITQKRYTLSSNSTFTKSFAYNLTRVSQVTDKRGSASLHTTSYDYDALDRIVSETKNGSSKQYTYDTYGQLTQEIDNALDKKTVYVYNGNGSIVSVTSSKVNGSDASTKTFTYDTTHPDRLVSHNGTTIPYDSYGYPTTYNGYTLTWSRGRLAKMTKGTKQTGQETYSYTYNAFGQRIKKTYTYLNTSAGFQPVYQNMVVNSTTEYEYDSSGRLIRETVNERYFEGTTSGRTLVYLYDASSMIGVRVITQSTTNTYYYNRNLQGDVTEIYTAAGVLKAKYTYDAFGNCTVSGTDTSLGNLNPIRYRGYYYDKETKLYHLGARYYSPEWRRFISPDDTAYIDSETPNGLNLYCYCNNDPVNNVDPIGHFAISLATFGIWALVGIVSASMVIGGGAQLVSNALAGETGSDLWRGVAGSAIGAGVNSLALCLAMPTGGWSLLIAAGAGAIVQTGVDTLETVIRGEKIDWGQSGLDLGINFVTTLAGNWIGSKLIPTNSGWFKPQKFLSVFTKSYGQKILLQTAIGAGLSGTVNFARKFDWNKVGWKKWFSPVLVPVVPLYPYF